MCGRYTLRANLNRILQETGAESLAELEWDARYNIAPTQYSPVVRLHEGKRELVPMKWGLIPSWAKDTKIANSCINARADTVATKPAFRSAFKKRRCLIPVDGYYEWMREGKQKIPHLYEIDDGKVFAFAGLWESWRGPEGDNIDSYCIITTDANELASKIHDRMPVIIPHDEYGEWLENGGERMLTQFDSGRMKERAVSTYVNNVKNQGEECVA